MEKFRKYIETWLEGKKIRGINMSPYDIECCIDVYNGIVRNEKLIFMNEKVTKILDKCNIKYEKYDYVNWRIV